VEKARKIFFITQFNPSFGKTLIAHCGGFKACNGYCDYLFRFFYWLGTVDRLILDVLGIGEHSGFAGNKYKGDAKLSPDPTATNKQKRHPLKEDTVFNFNFKIIYA
jgi:hypothetical protein